MRPTQTPPQSSERSPASPGAFWGDFSATGKTLIASIPSDAPRGAVLVAVSVVVRETLEPDQFDFWILQLGTLEQGKFSLLWQASLQSGLQEGVERTYTFTPSLHLSRGDKLALKVLSSGSPAPLYGLSGTLEWGILASGSQTGR